MTNKGSIARANEYVKTLLFGAGGELLPILGGTAGGSAITYWCDYYYCNTSANLYALFLGGYASSGSFAGLGSCFTYYDVSFAFTYIGSRLCFLPWTN